MTNRFFTFLFCVSYCFSFFSCGSRQDEKILANDLKFLLSKNSPTSEWSFENFKCVEPSDTLIRNLPFIYSEALSELNEHFSVIDTFSFNESTKKYAKALIAADFVYAAFSFQFLGPELGISNDTNLIREWKNLPLNICYDVGNFNQSSVYCIERTSFYLRLLDTLLNLSGNAVSTEFHTFPVIIINQSTYIIDPFDPFVITDSSGRFVVKYEQLVKERSVGKFIPERTKRVFGNSRELISIPFRADLSSKYDNPDCFCCDLKEYLQENKKYILSFLRPCFNAPDHQFDKIKILSNNHYAFSIDVSGRVDGHLNSNDDIVKYYVGVKCD